MGLRFSLKKPTQNWALIWGVRGCQHGIFDRVHFCNW